MQVESAELRIARSPAPDPPTLEAHYLSIFTRLKPDAHPPQVIIRFRRYASASARIRLQKGILEVKISDVLAPAPDEVHQALAEILVAKLCRCQVPIASNRLYRQYLKRPDVRRDLERIRGIRGRKRVEAPDGAHYNLNELFEELNLKYFFGLMPRPNLGWSQRTSKTLLGHYDPIHNTIVLSRELDRPDVPRLAVEYVLFHEMLHIKHPAEQRGSRRCVHTRAFKQEERTFQGFEQVQQLLKHLL